jgi:NADH dehydrogenase FAD-containing subunit
MVAGFAWLACARKPAKSVRGTLIDKNNYHRFQPFLYKLTPAELDAGDACGFGSSTPARPRQHSA